MLDDNQVKRLLDIAYAGCHKGMVSEGRKIFSGVLADRPGYAPAEIGLAFSHLVVDEFPLALEILNGVLDRDPGDRDALCMLGFCCFLSGDKDAAKEKLAPLADGDDNAASMAKDILAQI